MSHPHEICYMSTKLYMIEPNYKAGFCSPPKSLPQRLLPPLPSHYLDLALAVNYEVPHSLSCTTQPFTYVCFVFSLWLGTQNPLDIHLFIRISTESKRESHIRTGHVKVTFQYLASSFLKYFSQVQLCQTRKLKPFFPQSEISTFQGNMMVFVIQLHGSSFKTHKGLGLKNHGPASCRKGKKKVIPQVVI